MIGKIVAANEAIDAILADEADELDELDEANKAGIVMAPDVPDLLLPFSLTKCSALFSEDKVYFGNRVDVSNNKLLMARSQDELPLKTSKCISFKFIFLLICVLRHYK